MDATPRKKTAARRRPRRYTIVAGKRVKYNARADRIFRLAKKALKGIEVPPS